MKKPTTLKHLGLMLLVSSFAVGCASTTEEAPQEPAAVTSASARTGTGRTGTGTYYHEL